MFAKASQAAYDLEKGGKSANIPRGYEVDKSLSGRNTTVLYNAHKNKAIVAYRGTRKSNMADVATDAAILFGFEKLTPRFRNAEKVAKKTVAKYGKTNVALTGHSLGGTQALEVNEKLGLQTHAYNPGFGPRQLQSSLLGGLVRGLAPGKARPPTATVHTTGSDPISLMSLGAAGVKKKVTKAKSLKDTHGLKNFL